MIVVVGAGGVGFWVSLALHKLSSERIIVFDDDALEGSGAERLLNVRPFGRAFSRKVELLKFLAPALDVRAEKFVPSEHAGVLTEGDLLLDCTDLSVEERSPLVVAARDLGAEYLRASYDLRAEGFVVVVARGLGFSTNPQQGGYTFPPSIAHAMIAGGFVADVVYRLRRGEPVVIPKRLEVKLL